MSNPEQSQYPRENSQECSASIEVLHEALQYVQLDGSVWMLGEDGRTYHRWSPSPTVDVRKMPPDVYSELLIRVAREICGTLAIIQHKKTTDRETELRLLGLYLSTYREHPEFLLQAASLTQVSPTGLIHYPQLPEGSSWDWVPALRLTQG